MSNVKTLFDIDILDLSMKEAVSLVTPAKQSEKKQSASNLFFFVNADCFNIMFRNKEYHEIIKNAPAVFGDGSGVRYGLKLKKRPIKENINGTDMFPLLCEAAVKNNLSLFLLGGKPGVSEDAGNFMIARYPDLKIAGTHHGYFDKNGEENEAVIRIINETKADILFVAFGAPIQEKWIMKNEKSISSGSILGVGGLFDYFSDKISRAPEILRKTGFEWTYRLYQEPQRLWRRYILGNPLFLYRVIRWIVTGRGIS